MCGFRGSDGADQPIAAHLAQPGQVTSSPFGASDEIGMLNLITPRSRRTALEAADATKVFDLSVEYFIGMPSWSAAGEPGFQISMVHTPDGTVADDPLGIGRERNQHVGWSADAISMFTHAGTHIDALNHYGYGRKIWNGFSSAEHLGSRSWRVAGAEKIPAIIARGVLLDAPALHGVDVLPDSHGIGPDDLRGMLSRQGTRLHAGDVVMLRTGRMTVWPDTDAYLWREPGLTRAGAEFLAEQGAMVIGADNIALEQAPSSDEANWSPVHTYLLAEAGVPIMEVVNLEGLSEEEMYEFVMVGSCQPLRGATGAPIRPMAMPMRTGP